MKLKSKECKRKWKQLNISKVHKSKLKLQYAKEICSNDPSLTHSNLNESHHDESNFPWSSEIKEFVLLWNYSVNFDLLSEKRHLFKLNKWIISFITFLTFLEKKLYHHIKKYILVIFHMYTTIQKLGVCTIFTLNKAIFIWTKIQ